MLSFKANYGQDPRMGFKVRKKRRYKGAEKFIIKIKKKFRRKLKQPREGTKGDKEIYR